MTIPLIQNFDRFADYRTAAAELADLRVSIEQQLNRCHTTGEIPSLGDLEAKTAEFRKLREEIGPAGIVLATYGVNVIDDHTISYIIPRGQCFLEILRAADAAFHFPNLTKYNVNFTLWPEFTSVQAESKRITIDARVAETCGLSRDQQQELLWERGLTVAPLEEVLPAMALFYMATGESLSGWNESVRSVYTSRVAYGSSRYSRVCFDKFFGFFLDRTAGKMERQWGNEITIAARIP
jgi:hypothetical protein